MPFVDKERPGDFNQAVMDLGALICTPKNPECFRCPLKEMCLGYQMNQVLLFPKKSKKVKVSNHEMTYYFVTYKNQFLIRRRGKDSIWKNLYEFTPKNSVDFNENIVEEKTIKHKLTHKNLKIHFYKVILKTEIEFQEFALNNNMLITDKELSKNKSFPKPLQNIIDEWG